MPVRAFLQNLKTELFKQEDQLRHGVNASDMFLFFPIIKIGKVFKQEKRVIVFTRKLYMQDTTRPESAVKFFQNQFIIRNMLKDMNRENKVIRILRIQIVQIPFEKIDVLIATNCFDTPAHLDITTEFMQFRIGFIPPFYMAVGILFSEIKRKISFSTACIQY